MQSSAPLATLHNNDRLSDACCRFFALQISHFTPGPYRTDKRYFVSLIAAHSLPKPNLMQCHGSSKNGRAQATQSNFSPWHYHDRGCPQHTLRRAWSGRETI